MVPTNEQMLEMIQEATKFRVLTKAFHALRVHADNYTYASGEHGHSFTWGSMNCVHSLTWYASSDVKQEVIEIIAEDPSFLFPDVFHALNDPDNTIKYKGSTCIVEGPRIGKIVIR